MVKKGLGKGLQALIPINVEEEINGAQVKEIKLKEIKPNAFQPRRVFNEERLKELAESIKEHGVVQPVLVRKTGDNSYELVAGERRWRAAQLAGLEVIPAVTKDYSNQQMTEIALIENIQRENLNPIEEAQAYKKLMVDFGLTQEQLSTRVGKSRPFIANLVRLLNLHPAVQDFLSRGMLTIGHARPILAIDNKEKQFRLAEEVIRKNLSARETEALAKEVSQKKSPDSHKREEKRETIYNQIEEKLRGLLGTQIKVKNAGEKGKIEIAYYSLDELERLTDILLGRESF